MDIVLDGKSTVQILRNAMNLLEPRLTGHGERVAYIYYHMLMLEGKYSKKVLDDFFILGMLHDICAYKTDEIDNMLSFDSKGVWSHSVYGFLYLKYLSPLYDISEILLYHHLHFNKFSAINCQYKNEAMLLYIADRLDIALQIYGNGLDIKSFEAKRGTVFWGQGLNILYEAEERFDLTGHLMNGYYKKDVDRFISKIELPPHECVTYMRLLVYMTDFKTERTTVRNVNTSIISDAIAREMHLGYENSMYLYYASILYDIGMLGMPSDILRAPRKLTDSEKNTIHSHVSFMKSILSDNIHQEVINIAAAHHERMDGSGYPNRLSGSSLSLPQRILAVSDVISALNANNERRDAFDKQGIIKIISQEAMEGKLCSQVVNAFLKSYDYIMDTSEHLYKNALENYWAIKDQYDIIIKRFDAYNAP